MTGRPWNRIHALLLICFATVLFVGNAQSQTIYTFTFDRAMPSPDINAFALEYGDDGSVWVHGRVSETIYELDPSDASVIQSFPSNSNFFTISDLDAKDGILYGGGEPSIYRYETATGNQLSSLTSPITGGSRGLTFVGEDLYISGVLEGFPGVVRLGRIDRTSGALLGSSEPANLTESHGIGEIDQYVCYLVEPPYGQPGDVVLRIVDPVTGDLIEDHVLFVATNDLWSVDASCTELFVSRRDLDEIWVYTYTGGATAIESDTWGRIKATWR